MTEHIPITSIQALVQTIRGHHALDEQEAQVVVSLFRPVSFKRKELLLRAGETSHHLYFVVRGTLHMYYADEKGQLHSCNFFMAGELVTDLESFSTQVPAGNHIEALTRTDCLSSSCKDTVSLMQQSPAFNKYILDIVEETALHNINRTKDLLSLQPESRYQKLLVTRPDIIREVPQKYIARFLGMSPESLSRIRGRHTVTQ